MIYLVAGLVRPAALWASFRPRHVVSHQGRPWEGVVERGDHVGATWGPDWDWNGPALVASARCHVGEKDPFQL